MAAGLLRPTQGRYRGAGAGNIVPELARIADLPLAGGFDVSGSCAVLLSDGFGRERGLRFARMARDQRSSPRCPSAPFVEPSTPGMLPPSCREVCAGGFIARALGVTTAVVLTTRRRRG